jgi:hypothetical protein
MIGLKRFTPWLLAGMGVAILATALFCVQNGDDTYGMNFASLSTLGEGLKIYARRNGGRLPSSLAELASIADAFADPEEGAIVFVAPDTRERSHWIYHGAGKLIGDCSSTDVLISSPPYRAKCRTWVYRLNGDFAPERCPAK